MVFWLVSLLVLLTFSLLTNILAAIVGRSLKNLFSKHTFFIKLKSSEWLRHGFYFGILNTVCIAVIVGMHLKDIGSLKPATIFLSSPVLLVFTFSVSSLFWTGTSFLGGLFIFDDSPLIRKRIKKKRFLNKTQKKKSGS